MKREVIRSTWPRIRTKKIRGRVFYQIDARRKGTNGRVETKADKAEAQERANAIAADFTANGTEGLAVSGELRVMAVKGEALLQPYGKTIFQACEFYRDFLRHEAEKRASGTVEKLASDWYRYKSSNKAKVLRRDTLIGIRRGQLELTKAFGKRTILDISPKDIRTYLDGQDIATISKKNLLSLFGQFWNWALGEGYAKENPCKALKGAYAVASQDVVIWSAEEAREAMQLCEKEFPELMLFHAIGLFAGLRPAECRKLTWKHIHFDEKTIMVLGGTSKTKESRPVPIEDTLLHWLNLVPEEKRKGLVVRAENFTNRAKVFRAKLGYRYLTKVGKKALNPTGERGEYVADILRHCYGSYWLMKYKQRGELAEHMGNSIEVIKNHYKRVVTKAETAAFWNILPAAVLEEQQRLAAINAEEDARMESDLSAESVTLPPDEANIWGEMQPV